MKEFSLRNGAKVLAVDVPGTSVLVASAVFRSGFMFADPKKYEIPHVLEHMMASGNAKYPTAKLFKTEVEKNGAYRNASTSPYLNTYDYECADFESARIIELLGAQISSPLFPDKSFATEVSNVLEELNRNTTYYEALAAINLEKTLMPERVLDHETRITQLPGIKLADLKQFYSRSHTAKNLFLFVAGDFGDKLPQTLQLLEQAAAPLAGGERFEFDQIRPRAPEGPLVINRDIKQLYYQLGGVVPELDYRQRMAGRLLAMLFTGGYRSWVHGEARERGIAYHVTSSSSYYPGGGKFSFYYNVSPVNAPKLFELMTRSYRRATAGDFDEADLDGAKNLIVGAITRSYQTAGDMLGWYVGNYVFKEEILHLDKYLADLRSVSKQEVVEIARHYAQGEWALSLVGDISKKKAEELYDILMPIWQK